MHLPFVLKPPFQRENANCWRVKLPDGIVWAADTEQRQTICPLVLFENAAALGPAHRAHADIAAGGAGQFSVWSNGSLYFSTSDNSNPNDNGREYCVDLVDGPGIPAESGPQSIQKVLNAVRALPAEFTPRQGYEAIKRGLDTIYYPAKVLNFNAERLAAELSDLQLVAERFAGYQAELSKTDAVFLSIFCAGRTWVRFFLQTYLEEVTGSGLSMLTRTLPPTRVSPSICFTHDFLDLFEAIEAEPWLVFGDLMRDKPLVLLTRDLRDLAVSWFHQLRRTQPAAFAKFVPSGSILEFVASPTVGIERLAKVHELERAFFERHAGPKIHLSYERLHASPQAEFGRLLAFLSMAPVQQAQLAEAVEKSSFRKMQDFEIEISRAGRAREYERLGVDNWSGNPDDLKVRAGKVGRYREILPDLADLDELASRYPATSRAIAWEEAASRIVHLVGAVPSASRKIVV